MTLSCFGQVKGQVCDQESREGESLRTRLTIPYRSLLKVFFGAIIYSAYLNSRVSLLLWACGWIYHFASFEVCSIATCDLLLHGAHKPRANYNSWSTDKSPITYAWYLLTFTAEQTKWPDTGWEWSSRPVKEDMQAPSNEGHIWQVVAGVWEGPSNAVLALLRSPVRQAPLSVSILCYV